jgi:hypothetical protein
MEKTELKTFIVACIEWKDAENWLNARDKEGYEIVNIVSEMYQGISIFNIVMRLNRRTQ